MKLEMQMSRKTLSLAWLIAPLLLLAGASQAMAASNGVRDQAHFFSANAIDQANQIIQQIDERHGKDLLIETCPQIPSDMQSQFDQLGKNPFFEQWARTRAQSQGVNGVYALICKNPPHVQVEVGNKTRLRMFTVADRDRAVQILLSAFRKQQFDQGLLEMSRFVQQQMDSHAAAAGSGAVAPNSGTPPSPFPNYNYRSQTRSWGIGSIACLIIGIVLLIALVRGIFGRSGGGYYGGGGGGYYPPQGGAYPPAGGYPGGYGGGGGGFGRGFLGGLLGGAVGGYAADRWMHGQQQGGYTPPASGGQDMSSGPDTSFTGSGGDFGGGGGDFGGGGGGDFGGGGGGDFGGGGGDSGGSGGGDF
jgi:hypothetical protein